MSKFPAAAPSPLGAFLKRLDFTGPCVDLIDDVTDWLMEHRPHLSYEECAERADRIVMGRLK
jgi:hypothetical protein